MVITEDWSIPHEQYYKQHKKIEPTAYQNKNFFANYGCNNVLIPTNRTVSEIEFERWCEHYDSVDCDYKNGNKGDMYFSIIYQRGFRRNNFFHDYIMKAKNGDIWIIEAKGGMTADGASNNIDKYTRHKFEALKEYASRHNEIKWGFVRAVDAQLYLSNTEWCEDVTNRNIRKPIEVFIN